MTISKAHYLEQVDSAAKRLMERDPSLNLGQATSRVLDEHPDWYRQYTSAPLPTYGPAAPIDLAQEALKDLNLELDRRLAEVSRRHPGMSRGEATSLLLREDPGFYRDFRRREQAARRIRS